MRSCLSARSGWRACRLEFVGMTGEGTEEQAADLAEQAEALLEQGWLTFQQVKDHVESNLPADDAAQALQSVANHLAAAVDANIAEVIAAAQIMTKGRLVFDGPDTAGMTARSFTMAALITDGPSNRV